VAVIAAARNVEANRNRAGDDRAPALLVVLIHRSAWKEISEKSRHLRVPEIIHIPESLCTTATCSSHPVA
jgi:hypothetical protein